MQQNDFISGNNTIRFPRGPYGEILPLAQRWGVNKQGGKGSLRRWRWLKAILAGDHEGEIECALYEAVMKHGEPLSLRSPNSLSQSFNSFAPVLTYLGNFRWRMGLIGHGRLETFFERDAAEAVNQARRIYLNWARAEAGATERPERKQQVDLQQGDESDEI